MSIFLMNYAFASEKKIIEQLSKYDVISLDIFDTLVFRKCIKPSDIFTQLETTLEISGLYHLRKNCELLARINSIKAGNGPEVTLYDIWKLLSEKTSVDAEVGMNSEIELEKLNCYPNIQLQKIFYQLLSLNKLIILTSDMYLSKDQLLQILEKCHYEGFSHLYVSSEYKKNKCTGTIYSEIKKDFPNKSIVHIGDNFQSDFLIPSLMGLKSIYYKKR